MTELHAFLDGLTCTRPFTIADATALHGLIHTVLAGAVVACIVDVYTTNGDAVHVRVETPRGVVTRDLPAL